MHCHYTFFFIVCLKAGKALFGFNNFFIYIFYFISVTAAGCDVYLGLKSELSFEVGKSFVMQIFPTYCCHLVVFAFLTIVVWC